MSLQKSVSDFLLADAGINAAVGGRIYNGRIPKHGQLPAIVLTMITETPYNHLTNESAIRAPLLQIDVYDRDPQAQDEVISDLILSRLSGYRGDLNSEVRADSCLRTSQRTLDEPPDDGTDNWIRRTSTDYRIHYFVAEPAH